MKLLTHGDREQWLQARTLGIGSSDAPILLGLSKRKSPLELWAEKVGLEVPTQDETELMEAGIELQPGIGRLFAKRSGRVLLDIEPWTVYQANEVEWALASPDFFCEPIDSRGPGGVEVKFVTFVQPGEWDEEPPLAAQVQVQHQMYVLDRAWWTIAGLVQGRIKYADIERNPDFLAELLERECQFWERVKRQDPPSPDASESARKILDTLYPKETAGKIIPLPAEAREWDEQYAQGNELEKEGKRLKGEAKNLLRATIGDAERGVLPGGGYWTLKTVSQPGQTIEPYSYRDLRRHKGR